MPADVCVASCCDLSGTPARERPTGARSVDGECSEGCRDPIQSTSNAGVPEWMMNRSGGEVRLVERPLEDDIVKAVLEAVEWEQRLGSMRRGLLSRAVDWVFGTG